MPHADLATWIGSQALVFAAVVVLTRRVARVAPPWTGVLSYPLLLTSSEFLFGFVPPHGSFGAMGYSLVDVLPLLQVASLGGVAALSFCVALLPMTIALWLVIPGNWRAVAVAGAAPLLVAIVFGAVRLTQTYEARSCVALMAIDAFEARAYAGDKEALGVAQAYADQVRALAAQEPSIVVLPEKQFGGAREAGASAAILAAAGVAIKAPIVAGLDAILPEGQRVNSAQLVVPNKATLRYLKRRLLPGLKVGYTRMSRRTASSCTAHFAISAGSIEH